MSKRGFISSIVSAGNADFSNANVVCDGNSLTYGQGASNPALYSYPKLLKGLAPFNNPGCTVTNVGISGRTTIELISEAPSKVDTLLVPGKRNILIFFEIINHLYNNCVSAATAEAAVQTYCLARKSAGWEVWVGGSMTRALSLGAPGDTCGSIGSFPFDTPPTWLEERSRLAHELVAANFGTYADKYFNVRANNLLNTDTAYFADNIHRNDAGYALLAQIVANAA